MPPPPDARVDFAGSVYVKADMRPNEDRLAADTLVQAGLWGHRSNGVLPPSRYVAGLQAGVCDPVADPCLAVDWV